MSAIFQSWTNQNRYRQYPFRDDANLSPVEDPDLRLPDGLILDLALSVPVPERHGVVPASPAEIRLSSMMYGGSALSLFFSNGSDDVVASASVANLGSHVPGNVYQATGSGEYDDVRGTVVVGDVAGLVSSFPQGFYTFSDALVEASAIRPVIRGVRSIRVSAGNGETDPLYGHVELVEGHNVKLTVLPDLNAIRIDAVETSGFKEDCECSDQTSTPIRTVNGISSENLRIIPGQCVDIDVEGNVLKISDTCSKPCCGCEELNYITDRLAYLENAVQRVETYASTLNSIVPVSLASVKVAAAIGGKTVESNVPVGGR